MSIYRHNKKRNFSVLELIVYIMVLPIILGILSSLFIYSNNVAKSVTYNTKVYSDISFFLNTLTTDLNNAYYVDVQTDKILIKNSTGNKVYYFDKDANKLLIDDYNALSFTNFEIKEITSNENVFPLYEISITTNLKDISSKTYSYSFTSKFTTRERK